MKKTHKIFIAMLCIVLPLTAYASYSAGKAYASSHNMTAIPLSGVNSSGEMIAIRVNDSGYVLTTCSP